MALKKKQISYLLVAALAGGTIIGEGIGLYKLNEQVDQLNKTKSQLELKVQNLDKTIKEKDNTIKEKDGIIENVTQERDNNKKSIEELQKENKALNQKLEAKKQEEASAIAVASAGYPTQNASKNQSTNRTPVTMTLTFYGDFAHENGGYAGIDAQGNKLAAGTVASNTYPFGTKFELNGQVFTVRDRGGSNFNSSNRLDVFVPRKSGESNSAYAKRIREYGRKTVTMYKLS